MPVMPRKVGVVAQADDVAIAGLGIDAAAESELQPLPLTIAPHVRCLTLRPSWRGVKRRPAW